MAQGMATARQIKDKLVPDGTAIATTSTAQSGVYDIRRKVPQSIVIDMTGTVDVKIEYAISKAGEVPPAAAFGDNADIISNMTTSGRPIRITLPAINAPFVAILVTGNAGNGANAVIVSLDMWSAEAP